MQIFFGDIAYLEDGGLQRTYISQDGIIDGADAIKADTQTYHIELRSGEAFDTGRIADMPEYLMRESLLQACRSRFECLNLPTRKSIELR